MRGVQCGEGYRCLGLKYSQDIDGDQTAVKCGMGYHAEKEFIVTSSTESTVASKITRRIEIPPTKLLPLFNCGDYVDNLLPYSC
jgi:hypothetical protein